MKKKLKEKRAFAEKFRNEKLESKKMNYLIGGDANGGEGAPPDPWGNG
jgi:hypothetical protein